MCTKFDSSSLSRSLDMGWVESVTFNWCEFLFSVLTVFHTFSLPYFPLLLSSLAISTPAFSTPAFSAPPAAPIDTSFETTQPLHVAYIFCYSHEVPRDGQSVLMDVKSDTGVQMTPVFNQHDPIRSASVYRPFVLLSNIKTISCIWGTNTLRRKKDYTW